MTKSVKGVADFQIQTEGFTKAARDLKAAGPQFNKRLAKALKESVAAVVTSAKSNAGFSRRIPGSIRSSATAKGVSVAAGGKRAPHAAPFENEGKPGSFRHPVFGDRNRWVSQRAHPYLKPAIDAHVDADMLDAVTAAMDNVLREAGFK